MAEVQTHTLTLIGDNELLMDRDNLTFAEQLKRWQLDPANKDQQIAGDDRAPAWAWLGKLHYEDVTPARLVGIPMGMLAACIRDGAAMIRHPTARNNKTLKDISQSGILFMQALFPITVKRGGEDGEWHSISYTILHDKLRQEPDFLLHQAVAQDIGCTLDVRRAKPPGRSQGRHVRVRPAFIPWRVICEVKVLDEIITPDLLLQIFTYAGRYKGLGNWRPSTPKAGAYGTFSVTME